MDRPAWHATAPGASAPPDDALAFDDLDDAPRHRRRALLLVAAALPWAIVALTLTRSPRAAQPPAADSAPAPAPSANATSDVADPAAGPAVVPSGAPAAPAAPAAVDTLAIFGGRSVPGPQDAAALALIAARAWLGDVGPEPELFEDDGAAGTSYVDQLAVEAVDHPGPGAVVVTVIALVLRADGDRYDRAEPMRVAVPVRLDARGARLAGVPWHLAPPALSLDPLRWRPITEPSVLADAGAALDAAGYRDVAVRSLGQSRGWPLRVRARAVAPGASTAADHEVWLRPHLGRLVVAGDLPPAATR